MPGVYEVEGRLGRGGMGVVDLASAPDGRRVALKRIALHGSTAELAAARARIRREAEVLSQLRHPAVVELLDVLDDGDDVVLVMPWLRGGSLHDRVSASGPLDPAAVALVADELLGGLAAAHRAGVVHRDLKPANVLFDDDGHPVLTDFGVATARGVTEGLTVVGAVLGTPGFLAPEQARGEVAEPAADVFSLGATLLWAATGVGPYGSGTADVLLLRATRGKAERCPKTLPAPLRQRIDAMLDPRPERRPTAAALAGGPDGTRVRPVRARPVRSRKALAAVATVAAAVVAAVAVLALSRAGGPGSAAPPTSAATVPSTAPCASLPYLPCGGVPAPGTDGQACIDARADYDGDAANGCEAVPDALDGATVDEALEANLVPADDVDEFAVEVADHYQLRCDGTLRFTVTAPAGATVRLVVLAEGGDELGEITSADGVAGVLRIREPDCGGNDGQTLTARVTPVGSDRTAAPYLLERSGSF